MPRTPEVISVLVEQDGRKTRLSIEKSQCDLAQFSLRNPKAPGRPDVEEVITAAFTDTSFTEAIKSRPYKVDIVGDDGQIVLSGAGLEDYVGKNKTIRVIIGR